MVHKKLLFFVNLLVYNQVYLHFVRNLVSGGQTDFLSAVSAKEMSKSTFCYKTKILWLVCIVLNESQLCWVALSPGCSTSALAK